VPVFECFACENPGEGPAVDLHCVLARNIKRYRGIYGLSQSELAERAGISSGFLAEIEIERKSPSLENLASIAGVFGLRPFRLLMGPDDVTDAMGPDAIYETAEKLKKRLSASIDEFVRESDPNKPLPPPEYFDSRGKRIRGR
jgi:transcriptional regulator with XRE-family HTH domain